MNTSGANTTSSTRTLREMSHRSAGAGQNPPFLGHQKWRFGSFGRGLDPFSLAGQSGSKKEPGGLQLSIPLRLLAVPGFQVLPAFFRISVRGSATTPTPQPPPPPSRRSYFKDTKSAPGSFPLSPQDLAARPSRSAGERLSVGGFRPSAGLSSPGGPWAGSEQIQRVLPWLAFSNNRITGCILNMN